MFYTPCAGILDAPLSCPLFYGEDEGPNAVVDVGVALEQARVVPARWAEERSTSMNAEEANDRLAKLASTS